LNCGVSGSNLDKILGKWKASLLLHVLDCFFADLQAALLALHRGLGLELTLKILESGGLIQKNFENLKSDLGKAKPEKAHF
jgi:hypothetical protein